MWWTDGSGPTICRSPTLQVLHRPRTRVLPYRLFDTSVAGWSKFRGLRKRLDWPEDGYSRRTELLCIYWEREGMERAGKVA